MSQKGKDKKSRESTRGYKDEELPLTPPYPEPGMSSVLTSGKFLLLEPTEIVYVPLSRLHRCATTSQTLRSRLVSSKLTVADAPALIDGLSKPRSWRIGCAAASGYET